MTITSVLKKGGFQTLLHCGLSVFLLASAMGMTGCVASTANAGGPSQKPVTRTISGLFADYSFDDFVQTSDVICTAKYVGRSDGFLIEPVDGSEPMMFTDYYFDCTDALKGVLPVVDGDAVQGRITVRQKGGEGMYTQVINEYALDPQEGEEYLLFLYSINGGQEYNTEGDHFYLKSGSRGAWLLADDGAYRKVDGSEAADASMIESVKLAPLADEGVEGDYLDRYLEEVNRKCEDGQVTSEFRDQVAEKVTREKSQYSRVMTKDEQASYENRELLFSMFL